MRFQKCRFGAFLLGFLMVTVDVIGQTASQPVVQGAETLSGHAVDWIIGLLAAIVVLLGVSLVAFLRHRTASVWAPPRVLAMPLVRPAPLADNAVPALRRVLVLPPEVTEPSARAPEMEAWKQRALAAEATAGRQGEVIREKMIPQLTEFAKQGLVQGLVAQREVLIETQRKAQTALTELEARMNTLQTPLQERIQVYEKRVAELEQAVETQGQEMRELTRATLSLVRERLAIERQSAGLQSRFN